MKNRKKIRRLARVNRMMLGLIERLRSDVDRLKGEKVESGGVVGINSDQSEPIIPGGHLYVKEKEEAVAMILKEIRENGERGMVYTDELVVGMAYDKGREDGERGVAEFEVDGENYRLIFPIPKMTGEQYARSFAVICGILNERSQQIQKWGDQVMTGVEWLAVLSEEVGEAAKEITQHHFSKGKESGIDKIREEMIQVAAVACQIVERINEGDDFIEGVRRY